MSQTKSIQIIEKIYQEEMQSLQIELKSLETQHRQLLGLLKGNRLRFLKMRTEHNELLVKGFLADVQLLDQALENLKKQLVDLYEMSQTIEQKINGCRHRIQLKKQEQKQIERLQKRLKMKEKMKHERFQKNQLDDFAHYNKSQHD